MVEFKYVDRKPDGSIKIRWSEIKECTDADVTRDLDDIHLNTPDLFED